VAQYYVLFVEEGSSDAIPVKAKVSKTGGLTIETEALNLEEKEEEEETPRVPTRRS
jgi:hypothetical protein